MQVAAHGHYKGPPIPATLFDPFSSTHLSRTLTSQPSRHSPANPAVDLSTTCCLVASSSRLPPCGRLLFKPRQHPRLPATHPCPPSSPTSPSPLHRTSYFSAPLTSAQGASACTPPRPRIHIRIHRPLPYIYAGRSTAATTNSSSRPSRSQPWQALRRASSSSSADGHPLRARPGVPAAHPPAGGGARPRLRVPLRLGGPPCCPPGAAGFVFLGGHQVSICLPAALP